MRRQPETQERASPQCHDVKRLFFFYFIYNEEILSQCAGNKQTKKRKAIGWQFSMSDMNKNMVLIDLQAHLPSSRLQACSRRTPPTWNLLRARDLADVEQSVFSRPAAFITAPNASSGKLCEEFYGPGLYNLTRFYLFSLSFIDLRLYLVLSHWPHSCLWSEWFLCPFAYCFV